MTLGYYFFSNPILFDENNINVISIENKQAFRKFVEMFISAVNGDDVEIKLTDDSFKSMNIQKTVDLITDIYAIDFENKKIITKINEEISELCKDYEDEVFDIIIRLNSLAGRLFVDSAHRVSFTEVSNIPQIIKFFDFHMDVEQMSLEEKILEHMKLCRDYFGKKLFVFVNLHTYFNKEELESLYRNIRYEKFNVLLLESYIQFSCSGEKVLYIDEDLCEIY